MSNDLNTLSQNELDILNNDIENILSEDINDSNIITERIKKIDEKMQKANELINKLKKQKQAEISKEKSKNRKFDNHKKLILGGDLIAYFKSNYPALYTQYINIKNDIPDKQVKEEIYKIIGEFLKTK